MKRVAFVLFAAILCCFPSTSCKQYDPLNIWVVLELYDPIGVWQVQNWKENIWQPFMRFICNNFDVGKGENETYLYVCRGISQYDNFDNSFPGQYRCVQVDNETYTGWDDLSTRLNNTSTEENLEERTNVDTIAIVGISKSLFNMDVVSHRELTNEFNAKKTFIYTFGSVLAYETVERDTVHIQHLAEGSKEMFFGHLCSGKCEARPNETHKCQKKDALRGCNKECNETECECDQMYPWETVPGPEYCPVTCGKGCYLITRKVANGTRCCDRSVVSCSKGPCPTEPTELPADCGNSSEAVPVNVSTVFHEDTTTDATKEHVKRVIAALTVVAIVVWSLFGLLLIVVLVVYCVKYRSRSRKKKPFAEFDEEESSKAESAPKSFVEEDLLQKSELISASLNSKSDEP